jgi:hypothetical protein
MLDLAAEQPIALKDACRLVPPARNGHRTHLSTLLRWILTGARSPAGGRVRLEAVRIGSRWMTSREALQRFAEALTPRLDAGSVSTTPALRTPTERRRASERAARELEQLGV